MICRFFFFRLSFFSSFYAGAESSLEVRSKDTADHIEQEHMKARYSSYALKTQLEKETPRRPN